jgi:hypothetical protein
LLKLSFGKTSVIVVPIFLVISRHAFNRERHTLTNSNAHGGERKFAAVYFQTVSCRQRQTRTGHAKRVAKCDGAAMRIDVRGVVGKA